MSRQAVEVPTKSSSVTWIQPGEDCGQYNNTPLRQLTIKIPSSLSSWETFYKEFRSGDLLRFETPLVLPEGFEHQLPAGFQSTSTDMKVIDVMSENDCNMTIRVDNTCLWACDEVRRDSDEGGLLIGTPLKHMLTRVCPHCVIMGVDEKDMSTFVTISKGTTAWWNVCEVNFSQPFPNQPMQENRRKRHVLCKLQRRCHQIMQPNWGPFCH